MARTTRMVVVDGVRYRPEDVPERAQGATDTPQADDTPSDDTPDAETGADDAEDDATATKQRTPRNKARTTTDK